MTSLIFCLLIVLKLPCSITCPYAPQYRLDSVSRRYQEQKEIQLYRPFKLDHESTSSSSLESMSLSSTEDVHLVPDIESFKRLLSVNKCIPTWHCLSMDLDKLASNLRISFPFLQERLDSSVFLKGGQVEKTIDIAVDILENYRLESKERIWVLAVLSHLQDYLPKGELVPIVTDMTKEPIRHAALQLHLTKGLKLIGASWELWKSQKGPKLLEIDLSLSEALSKLKIIQWITSQFKMNEASKSSRFMVETHDLLLQEGCPMEDEKLRILLSRCSEHLQAKDTRKWDKELAYMILHKYEKIYPTVREFLTFEKLKNSSLKKACEYKQTANLVHYYLTRKDLGPFKNLLSVFLEEKNMNMNNIKNVIKSMIRIKQKYTRWETKKPEQLATREDLAILLLRHISAHIDGAGSYLEGVVNHSSDSQLFELKIPELNPIGQVCVVCQQEMNKEDDLVKLHHKVDHQIHVDCWSRLKKNSTRTPVCPICREEIGLDVY